LTPGTARRRRDDHVRLLETLVPILTAAGIELNEPMVARIHNEIKA
jgi:electron transfer flavoprotein alpha/beta subunit